MRDSIASVELAVGGAAAILGIRAVSLFHAASAVPEVHAELVRALDGDAPELGRLVRRLGFRSPYAEFAGGLIRAAQSAAPNERRRALTFACEHARAQVQRRFQRDQSLDLIAIAVCIGVAAFAYQHLADDPWFWPLAGALLLVLLLGLVARGLLRRRIDSSLSELAENIAQRPSIPARAPLKTAHCPSCGHTLLRGNVTLKLAQGDEPADALLCESCGYVQATFAGHRAAISS